MWCEILIGYTENYVEWLLAQDIQIVFNRKLRRSREMVYLFAESNAFNKNTLLGITFSYNQDLLIVLCSNFTPGGARNHKAYEE